MLTQREALTIKLITAIAGPPLVMPRLKILTRWLHHLYPIDISENSNKKLMFFDIANSCFKIKSVKKNIIEGCAQPV